MAAITLSNVNKTFSDGTVAVDDFNLKIQDKEFVVLVGPSGCGKSTTLRMIAGLEEISSGELYIGDRLVNDIAPKDRDIAMVFQSYALYPDKTVYKNIAFGLERRKVAKDEIDRRVKNAAKILDIEHLLQRKPKALSGGQRQRVALGRAIVRDPSVFLFDEPLSNLDAKLRTAMRTEITKLHRDLGTTFVYVTHDQTEAMTMGDRIVVMKDGVVQQVDTPQKLYDSPCNMFVAGFIGSPQMNFIDAQIEKIGKDFFAKSGVDLIPLRENTEKLGNYIGKKVKIGVRPERITDDRESFAKNLPVLEGVLEVSELMGSEVYLHIDYNSGNITARVDPKTTAETGKKVLFQFKENSVHVFDNETGKVIR